MTTPPSTPGDGPENVPLKRWKVESYGRAVKVGYVTARTRKEAMEKLEEDDWECVDTYERQAGMPRLIGKAEPAE